VSDLKEEFYTSKQYWEISDRLIVSMKEIQELNTKLKEARE
jgi:hypothetical protein